MYTINSNSNTLWKLSSGDKLNLIVTVPGMKVYLKPYNTKSFDKEFTITVVNGDSLGYKTLPSSQNQEALDYINFCSATGKIIIEANQDFELVVTSVTYDANSNTNSCKGPITVHYSKTNSISSSMNGDSSNGFESIFEILPSIASFVITIIVIALITYCIFSTVTKRSREGQLDEAIPPILTSQSLTPDQFDQYIPPTIQTSNNVPQPQYQQIYYSRPVVFNQYPGAINV